MSILTGIDNLVDDWLGVEPKGKPPHYQHRATAQELTRRDEPITGTMAFLQNSYDRIHANWLAAIDAGYTNPSKENWRWKRHPSLGTNNSSPELKVQSNTPLFAAIEIMKYGLLLVWSKNHQKALGYESELQPILAASTVTLSTLAPADYYISLDLTNLASALNDGLAEFGKRYDLNLGFEFCQLGANYTPELEDESVRSAVGDRQKIWGDK